MLKPGGRWLNFGSLAFAHGERALCYSLEEVAEIVAASGFAMPDPLERELPYMASPASRHARRETVVAFATPKTGEAELPAAHRAVPDWITRSDLPVPELPHFRSQALSTRVYAFILAMIDGRRTIRDMAAMMEEQRLMPRADAEQALRGFLTRVWEESRLRSEY
jgi:hypothetical protein